MKYILLILALAVRVAAASITHTAQVLPSPALWNFTNSIPAFDPALGALTNVVVSISANASTQTRAESQGAIPSLLSSEAVFSGSISIGLTTVPVTITNSHSQSVTGYDGVLDYGGTSGFNVTVSNSTSSSASADVSQFTSGALVLFVCSGSTATVTAGEELESVETGPNTYRFIVNTRASAIVTVTYEFSPPACPECPPAPVCDPKPDCKPAQKDDDDCDDDRRKRRNRRR